MIRLNRTVPRALALGLVVVSMTFVDAGNSRPRAAPQALAPIPKDVVKWTMINVNVTEKQGDAHLLVFPDGQVFLIDAADTGFVAPWLVQHGVRRLDKIIVSHAHKDHYGGIPAILEAGIAVSEVVFNVPDRALCDSEKPWGCDYEHVQATLSLARSRGVQVRGVAAGDRLYARGAVSLEVLAAYDGPDLPTRPSDVNDTSLVLLLTNGGTRVLFTGDLNAPLGRYLALNEPRVHADVLKVPHHGTDGLAPNEFFDRVGAKVALVPSPRYLWLGERSRRAREYFAARKVEVYVNGIHGDVMVRIGPRGFVVTSSRPTRY